VVITVIGLVDESSPDVRIMDVERERSRNKVYVVLLDREISRRIASVMGARAAPAQKRRIPRSTPHSELLGALFAL
jgi:hypothetical protein